MEKERETFEGPGELAAGVVTSEIDFGRGFDEVFYATTPQVARKKPVGVVQIADDLLETGEVFAEFRVEFGLGIEKPGHRGVFDGTDGVRIPAADRQRDNVFVAQHFQPDVRERLAQQAERGQRQQEIADGTAANDEDFGLTGSRHNPIIAGFRRCLPVVNYRWATGSAQTRYFVPRFSAARRQIRSQSSTNSIPTPFADCGSKLVAVIPGRVLTSRHHSPPSGSSRKSDRL